VGVLLTSELVLTDHQNHANDLKRPLFTHC